MEIKKMIIQREDDGALMIGDTILYEGRLWLVPAWLAGPTEKNEMPARIICLDGLGLQPAPSKYREDYFLSTPLSKAVLEGRAVKQGLVVIERPDIIRNV